tara:strand:- start:150 stop:683 length:534 start_codon:yes stop_codon:yes gene_type:complete
MKILAMDIETDALDATKIHVICAQDVDTKEKYQFLNVCTVPEEREAFFLLCQQTDKFVFHNGIGFDVKVINRLLNPLLIAYPEIIKPSDIIDTLIMSRLIDYSIKGGHSLKAWGQRLGEFKIGFDQFEVLTQEMIDYVIRMLRLQLDYTISLSLVSLTLIYRMLSSVSMTYRSYVKR